ncbi:MAG: hypothetical protein Q9168_004860 [Polycauliona sp. 1 TL-2023]
MAPKPSTEPADKPATTPATKPAAKKSAKKAEKKAEISHPPDKFKARHCVMSFTPKGTQDWTPLEKSAGSYPGENNVGIVEFKHTIHITQKGSEGKCTLDLTTAQYGDAKVTPGAKSSDPVTVEIAIKEGDEPTIRFEPADSETARALPLAVQYMSFGGIRFLIKPMHLDQKGGIQTGKISEIVGYLDFLLTRHEGPDPKKVWTKLLNNDATAGKLEAKTLGAELGAFWGLKDPPTELGKSLDETAKALYAFFVNTKMSVQKPQIPYDMLFIGEVCDDQANQLSVCDSQPSATIAGDMDAGQLELFKTALNSAISVCQCPPGTGKGRAIGALLASLIVDYSELVAVAASSSFAVDSQLETAVELWHKVMPLGTSPRFVRWYSEEQIRSYWAAGNRAILDAPFSLEQVRYQHAAKDRPRWGQYFSLREELEGRGVINIPERLKEYNEVVKELTKEVLETHAQAVFCTIVGAHAPNLTVDDKKNKFQYFPATTIICDEASTIYRPQMMMLIMAFRDAKRLVLVGDTRQLPGHQSNQTTKAYLPHSFMQDVVNRGFPEHELNDQYRMHDELYAHTAEVIYNRPMASDKKTSSYQSDFLQLLRGSRLIVEEPERTYELPSFLHFIDVPNGIQGHDGTSSYNSAEITAIQSLVLALLQFGMAPKDLCVLTGYGAQKRLLEGMAHSNGWSAVKCTTIDASQGMQWKVVLLSLVNTEGRVKFMGEKERANVATSRQQEALYIVGKVDFWFGKAPDKASKKWMHAILASMRDNAIINKRPAFIVDDASCQILGPMSSV